MTALAATTRWALAALAALTAFVLATTPARGAAVAVEPGASPGIGWCVIGTHDGGINYPCSVSDGGWTTIVRATAEPVLAIASATIDEATVKTLKQEATGQVLPSGTFERMNISVECAATASPNPLETGIQDCFLVGANGTRYSALNDGAMPGAADASIHSVLSVPTQTYRVCVRSTALFQDAVRLQAPAVCSP